MGERRRRAEWVHDPRADRQRALVAALTTVLVAAGVLSLVGVLARGGVSRGAGSAAVAAVVAAPLLRTLWLAVRWLRKGDRRFAMAAIAVVAIVGAGGLLALARG